LDFSTIYDLNKNIPESFKQDQDYLDSKESYGLKFPKQVIATAWSKERDLQGRDVRTLRLMDVVYKGLENQ